MRARGYVVLDTSSLGMGVPDLCVLVDANKQRSLWLEIKDGNKIPSKQRLTKDEEVWLTFNGENSRVVNSLEAALQAIEEFKRAQK